MADIKLRPSQEEVVSYTGGKMGVSAVPGAGKTTTLSFLAANLIERLTDEGRAGDQEVLIVTLTNSAVNSFRGRITRLVQQERGLLPYIGYRVRTLHSLAHDIVRMRPGLVGLSEGFEIIDERVASQVISDMATAWIRHNGDLLMKYMDQEFGNESNRLRNVIRNQGPPLIETIARETIRLAKDNLWEPDDLRSVLGNDDQFLLARIGVEMYEGYQNSLRFRGAVDFDDLVKYALQALEIDPTFLERLQTRWPYILEDEAQDSSQLQEQMLGLLSGGGNNWVRVGDPNQSIFTTFTTADSNLLLNFIAQSDVVGKPLPVSGRSSRAIIDLANYLVRWSNTSDLVPALNNALSPDPMIEPTTLTDPQANPENGFIYMDWNPEKNITPEAEVDRLATSLERWLPEHRSWTVAVLVPENSRGFKVAEALKEKGIPYEELLRSTSATRDAAERLYYVLAYLSDPNENKALARLYADVWWPVRHPGTPDEILMGERDNTKRVITRELKQTESFVWPGPEGDWLDNVGELLDENEIENLRLFRRQVGIWLEATTLPIDQLILTVAGDIFIPTDAKDGETQADLALAHKIAVALRGIAGANPDYRLSELATELRAIASNERRFLGFDDTAEGYEPQAGVVTIATMHAAKGLEWDRVYLMAVNNYSFPSAISGDAYMAEKWFVRDELNIQAESRAQVDSLMGGGALGYTEGEASRSARVDYAAERLRLLYVGITRAKRDLIITWNMGRFWQDGKRNTASQSLIALTDYWKEHLQ